MRVIVKPEVVTTVVATVRIGGQVTVVKLWSHPGGWVALAEVEEDSELSRVVVVVLLFELVYPRY